MSKLLASLNEPVTKNQHEMKSPWTELTFLVLGWLLGLVAGPIQAWMTRRHDRKKLRLALWTELDDLRERLALAAFLIESKRDGITRNLLDWSRKYIIGRAGAFPSARLTDVSKRLSELDDERFTDIAKHLKEHGPDGLALKRYELRYLASKLDRLELLPEGLQQHLLAVLTHIDFINQHVADSEFYRSLTFDSGISEDNYAIASSELKRCRDLVAHQARTIVRMIDALECELRGR